MISVQGSAGEIKPDSSPDVPPTYKQIKFTAMFLSEPFLKGFLTWAFYFHLILAVSPKDVSSYFSLLVLVPQ